MTFDARGTLLGIYRDVVTAVDGGRLVRQAHAALPPAGPVRLIAIGKAAGAMARGAREVLGGRIEDALVVTAHGHGHGPEGLGAEVIEAGHPLPDEASLRAGRALLEFLDRTPGVPTLLFLISGGASALVEVPRPGLGLDDLRRAFRWLLGSGLAIDEVNRIRGRLSCIKGGGLRSRLPEDAQVWQVLLSDVPGDDPGVIGSGLLSGGVGPGSTPPRLDGRLPDWLRAMLGPAPARAACTGPPVRSHVIPGSMIARRAAVAAARDRGLRGRLYRGLVSGDAVAAGRRLAGQLLRAPAGALHVWSGETVVSLPARAGQGGRCQSLALSAAMAMAGHLETCLLAAGTDGRDGPGHAAGAIVDGGTVHRGEGTGLAAADCLGRADAGSFLHASGDLIEAAPSGSNVMDLMLGWRYPGPP